MSPSCPISPIISSPTLTTRLRDNVLHFQNNSAHDRVVKTIGYRSLFLVAAILAVSALRSWGDDSYVVQPLVQARFDQLIPMSYPTVTPSFDRLRPTIWPLKDPGIAKIPTTENLIHPLDHPLLIVGEASNQSAQIKSKPQSAVLHPAAASHRAGERSPGR